MKRVDTYSLACLDALVTEAHVSRAAQRIGIGQPAMSEILARLREIFRDPLLVRTKQGMVATPRAIDAAEKAREALGLIERAVSGRSRIDLQNIDLDLRIVALNSLAFSFLPKLVGDLHQKAPNIRVHVQPEDMTRTRELLETNGCDLIIGQPPAISSRLHTSTLFPLHLCCIARKGHPEVDGRLTVSQFLSYPHVVFGPGPMMISTIETSVERALRTRRLTRVVGIRVPDLLLSPAVVAESDFLATIPERVARPFAESLGIQILQPPFPFTAPGTLMIWHERTHRDPRHRWIRQRIRGFAKQFHRRPDL